MGAVYVRDPDEHDPDEWIRRVKWEFHTNARGDVTVPLGKEVSLRVSTAACRDLSPLRRLAPEDVSTVASEDVVLLARVAYHLGNRHVRTQIGPGFVRYRHDRAIDELVSELGAEVTVEEAPFEPERGTRDHAHDRDLAS